jgi:hypothetical protein
MSDLEMKSFGPFEIKSEDKGEVVAIVATLGVVDKDGDVIMPGAVPRGGARVKLSGYGHDVVLKDAPPVGKGVITEEGDKLVFAGRFFMSTERGRDAFNHTKEMGEDGEWSFGFPKSSAKTANLTNEWRTKGAKRLLAGITAVEASPVFVGAGWGTGTLLTKSAEPVEAVAEPQADGDPTTLETPEEVEARILHGDPTAPEPQGVIYASAEPVETEEAKAAREAEIAYKAARAEMIEEMNRVQRSLKRNGLLSIPEVRLEDAA